MQNLHIERSVFNKTTNHKAKKLNSITLLECTTKQLKQVLKLKDEKGNTITETMTAIKNESEVKEKIGYCVFNSITKEVICSGFSTKLKSITFGGLVKENIENKSFTLSIGYLN
tara:strand:- start:452 stop:793 length:342 start_codon:yes stop_codon:yes gene_type:complete